MDISSLDYDSFFFMPVHSLFFTVGQAVVRMQPKNAYGPMLMEATLVVTLPAAGFLLVPMCGLQCEGL